jgi:3-oxoacyl-[acyl-carrier protein] reductase
MSITSVPAFLGVELPPSFSLLGRRAFITGASRGIGKACALALASAGADIAVGSSSAGAAEAEEVCARIRAMGRRAEAFSFDVRARGEVELMCGRVTESMKEVDILVNNAGVTRDGLFRKMDRGAWDDVIDTNLNSVFEITRRFIDAMATRGWGRVINISSIVGRIGNFGQANYAAAKAGLIGLTKTLAREYASRGVTVNAVSPGYIDTDMTATELPEARRAELIKTIPLARVGKPEDVAAAVAYLAGPSAGYVTGQVLRVNGGLFM